METRITQQQINPCEFLGAIKAPIALNGETSYQKTGLKEETQLNSNNAENVARESFPKNYKLWRSTSLLRLQELIYS